MFLVLLNLILVTVACGVNIWASLNGDPRKRPLWAATAVVCLVYGIAYAWLLVGDVDRGAWSEKVVGVGLIAWIVGWIAPAWLSVRLFQHDAQRIESKVDEL